MLNIKAFHDRIFGLHKMLVESCGSSLIYKSQWNRNWSLIYGEINVWFPMAQGRDEVS